MKRLRGSATKPLVSVLTPSIVERAGMLEECKQSVAAQTFTRWEHLVEVDELREGCAKTMNRVANLAAGEWLLPLADDDLLNPDCVEALVDAAADADVVYAPPRVEGGQPAWPYQKRPPNIPSCALIRTALWREIGGYKETLRREEDRKFWIAARHLGARFVRVDRELWVYRFHGGNKTFRNGVAA